MGAKTDSSSKRKSSSIQTGNNNNNNNNNNKNNTNDNNKKRKTKNEASTTTTAELSNSAKKREMKKERQSQRPHAEIVMEAKLLWNKLRLKTNTPEQIRTLMEQVMKLIRGKVSHIALQHDASRVVQAAVQFGTPHERKEILTELCQAEGGLSELSRIQYAHFCALKVIKYCAKDESCVKMIVKSFKGSIAKLAVHAVGSRVVESIFLNLPTKSTVQLKQEFYGRHFSLFANDVESLTTIPTLKTNLATVDDKQKIVAIEFVKDIITKAIGKALFGYTYVHDLLVEYIEVATPNDIRELTPSIVDHSIHLLSTRAGSKVVAECAAYGTPKDRKRILKSLKGYSRSSLLHRDAYLTLLRIIQVTDDTVSVHKSLLNELITTEKKLTLFSANGETKENENDSSSPLLELALSETACKIFLLLLVDDDEARMKYFDPLERSILEPTPMIVENGEEVPTWKKSQQAKRTELLQYISKALIDLCVHHTKEMIYSLPGSRVLKEVYTSSLASEDIVAAIVNICAATLDKNDGKDKGDDDDKDEPATTSLFEDPVGHLVIKNLCLCDKSRDDAPFSKALVEKLKGQLVKVGQSNRGAFVLTALCQVSAIREQVRKELTAAKPQLEKLLADSKDGTSAGYEALLKELSD